MSDEKEKPEEGWGQMRPGDRVFHYYRGSFSLCGRVGFYFGSKDADTGKEQKNDCKACTKKLVQEGKRPVSKVGKEATK